MRTLALFTIALFTLATIFGCKKDDEAVVLLNARNLEGVWITPMPVKFYIQTDFCANNLEDVATEDRTISWDIEAIDDDSVFITFNFSSSNFEIVNQNCNPIGYVPDVSAGLLTGIVSSSGLSVYEYDNLSNKLGDFTFTTEFVQGNWDDSRCGIICQRVYTLGNEYKLYLQD